MRLRTHVVRAVVALSSAVFAIFLVEPRVSGNDDTSSVPIKWESRAVPEARGEVKETDGKKMQVRYSFAPFSRVKGTDWSAYSTYAYDDTRGEIPVRRATPPAGVTGEAAKGRKIFMSRKKGPCTACHLLPGSDVWPAGNVAADLSNYGDRNLPDDYVYQVIYDPRVYLSRTAVSMPPWGSAGLLKPEEIMHLVAFVQTLKSPVPPETDPDRDPNTRTRSKGFGDNLDPTNNPAVILAEDALETWNEKGPRGKACEDCHKGESDSMKGIATRYPHYVAKYKRVMSIGDYLQMHGPETTGTVFPSQSDENLNMTMFIKMASNGMNLNVDLSSPEMQAALTRGTKTFHKKVGKRNHACADCHSAGKGRGAGRFLGGRPLADAQVGLTNHFPTFRTRFQVGWDIRKRFQWCMLPIGMNMLASDSVEYAELELYLASFSNGKPLDVPGIRH